MEITKCLAFVETARLGNMTRAAQRLNYTQAGITRMVRSLEEELGFSLFVRGKQGVALTRDGERMLPAITEIVQAHEKACQTAAELKGAVCGSITVGSYYSVSSMIMPQVLRRFQEKFSGIHVEIREGGNSELVSWLQNGQVDCCFCARLPEAAGCQWIPIFQDEMVVWLPENHPRAGDAAFPVRELEHEAFIRTFPQIDTDQARLLKKYGLHTNDVFSTTNGFSTYSMVGAGLGVSFNQRLLSRNWKAKVVELPFDPPQQLELGIALRSIEGASPAVQRFIECVKEIVPGLTEQE